MIKAKEARQIVEEIILKRIEDKKKMAREYSETLNDAIRKAAENGNVNTVVDIPYEICGEVKTILLDSGYKVSNVESGNCTRVVICWR